MKNKTHQTIIMTINLVHPQSHKVFRAQSTCTIVLVMFMRMSLFETNTEVGCLFAASQVKLALSLTTTSY